jgi:hypothetical protein
VYPSNDKDSTKIRWEQKYCFRAERCSLYFHVRNTVVLKSSPNTISVSHICQSKAAATSTSRTAFLSVKPYHEFHLAVTKTRATLRPVIQHCQFLLPCSVSDQDLRRYWVIVSRFWLGYIQFPRRSIVPLTFKKFPSIRVSVEQTVRL